MTNFLFLFSVKVSLTLIPLDSTVLTSMNSHESCNKRV